MHPSRVIALFSLSFAVAQQPPPGSQIQTTVERLEAPVPLASLNLTPEQAKKVVITIGDTRITAGDFDAWVEILPEQLRGYARGPNRLKFAENIVRIKLLAEEGRKRKIDSRPEFEARLANHTENLLAMMLFDDMVAGIKIDAETLRAFYEKQRSEYERVRGRHILIRFAGSPMPQPAGKKELSADEALAKLQQLRKRIAAGEDFAAIAKAESDDSGSAQNGGDLGWFPRRQMVPEFEEVAFSLKPGELSEPVRSPYGFHLIRVEEKDSKTLDELRPELEKRLRNQLGERAVIEMRGKANVTFEETFFGPGASFPAPPPAAQ